LSTWSGAPRVSYTAAVAGGHTNALEAAKPLWSGRDNCTNCRSLGNAEHVCARSNSAACRRRGMAIAIANTPNGKKQPS
jgi:hypothetical protein